MPDYFEEAKQAMLKKLGKPDKSKKGDVDDAAWPFIQTINSLNDYYTTSSCAGRITVFKEPESGKKHEADWLYVTHSHAEAKEVLASLANLPQETVWLRMESPIYHIACRDQQSAEHLLKLCQAQGWKRSGIISTGGKRAFQQRIMVEIIGNERIDAPIAVDGKLLMAESYVTFLVQKSNNRLLASRAKVEELRKKIEKEL